MKIIFAFLLLAWMVPVVIKAQTPVLEKEPVIWLRADRCGDSAGVWQDITGNGYHAVFQQGNPPDTGLFNYNKTFILDISSPGFKIGYEPENTGTITVFSVYEPADTGIEQAVWNLRIDSITGAGLTTHRMITARRQITYSASTTNIPVINTMLQNWRTRQADTLNSSIVLTGSDSLGFTGKLAEFILFEGALPKAQFTRIHTYLALKYGISLRNINYVNGNDSVVWNFNENKNWVNIAGIANDTILGIYQPQGAGRGGKAPLTIAAGTYKEDVEQNNTPVNHSDFIIWGDNDAPLDVVVPDTLVPDTVTVPFLMQRRWMMRRSGNTAHLIPTQLVFKEMLPDSSVITALVIDTTAGGEFKTTDVIIHYPDSIDTTGYIYFNNIFWNNNANGREIFTFQVFDPSMMLKSANTNTSVNNESEECGTVIERKTGSIKCALYPNPTPDRFSLIISLPAEDDVTVNVYDQTGRIVQERFFSAGKLYHLEGTLEKRGIYFIRVSTIKEQRTYRIVVN